MTDMNDDQGSKKATVVPSSETPSVVWLAILALLAGAATWLALSAAEQSLPTDRVSGVVSDQGVSRDADGDETYWTRFRLISGDEVRTSGRALYDGTTRGTEVQIELGRLTSRVMGVQWQGNRTDVRNGNGSILTVLLTGTFGIVISGFLVLSIRDGGAGKARRWQLSAIAAGIIVTIVWQLLITPNLGPR